MEAIEAIDRECAALGGLFQQVVNDMKTGVPHYEDFINKAGKFHSQLKNTVLALGSFLDTFQKIADAATNTKGATREIGTCLTRIVLRHKSMESRMKSLCSALLDGLVLPLQDKMEEWKKVGHSLDKEHSKEYKKLRGELKKKSDNASRILKKHKKSKGSERDPKVDQSLAEVDRQVRNLHETEKCAVRRVLVEERSRYCTFIAAIKPVLSEEISLVSEFQQLEEVLTKLDKHTEDPFKLPEASEQVLTDIKSGTGGMVFKTPPSSPSSLGSRKSSMCSISSAGSSSGGSSNSPSHQPNIKNRQVPAGPMRLSSISSQDSGFTSQDTLFLRPGSPHRSKTPNGSDHDLSGSGGSTPGGVAAWPGLVAGMPGPPMSDRPHTISSAYEKGHQRPQLQPYTFNPPERIHEEEERPGSNCGFDETSIKPPVPQRQNSYDRPRVPMKTAAALNAKLTQRHLPAAPNNLPTFNCNQPDMVVPQPVYMNMSDMALMAAAREAEEGLELKTPTADDFAPDPTSMINQQSSCNGVAAPFQPRGSLRGPRGGLHRPFSFTHGVIPEVEFSEALGAQLGVSNHGTILRRSMSQAADKPIPPLRRASSALSQEAEHEAEPGSNSTTPRGSMEFLPPPPPHLLHSDEEAEDDGGRAPSVAESVRALTLRQNNLNTPRQPSPAALRRVQSMSGPPGHMPSSCDRSQIKARLDVALSSPRARPVSPGGEQIYAPVAALQQKIQAQQQTKMAHGHNQPGMVPHPPGPQIIPQNHNNIPYQQQLQQQQQYQIQYNQQQQPMHYNQQQQIHFNNQQQQQQMQYQQQLDQQQQQHQQHLDQHGGSEYGFGMQFQSHATQWYKQQQQQKQFQFHDQIMQDMDPTLGQRPQPPDINSHNSRPNGSILSNGSIMPNGSMGNGSRYDHSRVRQWIETRSVSDVRKVRPILNQEIQRGFSLKKALSVSDRSTPRF